MKQKKGSITVEAVFIIPFIIIILLLFLWLSLYLHDQVVVRGTMQQVLNSAGDYIVYGTLPESRYLSKQTIVDRGILYAVSDSSPSEEERLENYFKMLLTDQLFLYQLNKISIQKKGCFLTMKAEFSCSGFSLITILLQKDNFNITFEEKCFWAVREEITRIGSVLLKFLDKVN